jgi:hypothetical protein
MQVTPDCCDAAVVVACKLGNGFARRMAFGDLAALASV